MISGRHGASISFPATVMNLANGQPGLRRLQLAVTRRFLYTYSKMYAHKNPPKWRLWQPNQGVVFQQPLYPVLDVARFFTEASEVEEIEDGSFDAGEEIARTEWNDFESSEAAYDDLSEPDMYDTLLAEEASADATPEGSTIPSTGLMQEDANSTTTDAPLTEPPFSPLDYKIPDKTFNAAMAAAEGTPESFWSYAMYRGPSNDESGTGSQAKVKVHYCKSARTAERVCQYFLDEKILGFDLEWSPEGYRTSSPRRNVSLVQLASQSRIALLHLALFPHKDILVAPTLRRIMEDPGITKTGVWIKGDCSRLQKYLGIESRGMFELSHLYRQVKFTESGRHDLINKKLVKLADLVQETLGLPLFKGHDVRASDWSRPLGMKQIIYSASDAYAAVHLYAMLNHQREKLNPTPAMPFHVEENKPIPRAPGVEYSSSDVADFTQDKAGLTAEQLEALEEIQMEDGDGIYDSKAVTEATKAPKAKRRSTAAAKSSLLQKDSRVVAAETWLMEYKATRPDGKVKSGGAALRAYFVWHANDDLGPDHIAQLLREPPLKVSTVCGYIFKAIREEKLPYDPVRLKAVLDLCPQAIVQSRYRTLVRDTAHVSLQPSNKDLMNGMEESDSRQVGLDV